jgi:hypothetical protein
MHVCGRNTSIDEAFNHDDFLFQVPQIIEPRLPDQASQLHLCTLYFFQAILGAPDPYFDASSSDFSLNF